MDAEYQIYSIDPALILDEQVEDGMLRKDWYLHHTLGKCLFKEAAPTQAIISDARTDWTEKVVNEIHGGRKDIFQAVWQAQESPL